MICEGLATVRAASGQVEVTPESCQGNVTGWRQLETDMFAIHTNPPIRDRQSGLCTNRAGLTSLGRYRPLEMRPSR